MARIDDYIAAKNLAAEKLSAESFELLAKRTGFEAPSPNVFRVPFLNRCYRVDYPGFSFRDEKEAGKEVPIQEQVLILHYMLGREVPALSGNWVAYREIPGAAFYFSAFVKRAVDPLKNTFGNNAAGLAHASGLLGGEAVEPGDAAFEFRLFPRVRLRLILWEGDEEFPPEANILFDSTIGSIFSPEDIAWLAGMLVYRLMALSR
ncbi:MAG: DUF3786 domain-containing protein [Thermodesulfobacteriota bacterium]